jgi:hypothetical protein
VRSNLDAISNSGTPNVSRENANRSFRPDENVIHFERSEPHRMMAQISEDLFFRKSVAVRAHKDIVVRVDSLE